jgi:uncharacterized protein (TIGR04255 family)
MASKRKYSRAPVKEVICECRFTRKGLVDPALPGLFYKQIEKEFPERKQRSVSFQEPTTKQRLPPINFAQFFRQDGRVFVQVSENLIAVNHLSPYDGWETFEPVVVHALQAYRTVSGEQEMSRIGLRYVNIFEFEGPEISLPEYFDLGFIVPGNIEPSLKDFSLACSFKGASESYIARAQLRSHPSGLLLDLDYSCEIAAPFDPDLVAKWLNSAHDRINEIFESCITDQTRTLIK